MDRTKVQHLNASLLFQIVHAPIFLLGFVAASVISAAIVCAVGHVDQPPPTYRQA